MQRITVTGMSCNPVLPVSQGIKFGSTQRLETTNHNVIHVLECKKQRAKLPARPCVYRGA